MLEAIGNPNLAFLMLVAGVLALYWELHMPGFSAPGLAGIVLVCAGLFGLWENAPTWYGSAFILLALFLFGFELKFSSHGASGVIGAIFLAAGAIRLIPGPHPIQPTLAVAVAAALAAITIFLGYLAFRSRRLAPITGSGRLIGQTGISRTNVGSEGTVFVQGEYWQARSALPIAPGTRVSIERVEGLILYVTEA
jgi:membrane-bound serine protease (ClpP class)